MAVEYKDYYKLLGVERKASKEEIGKAYKKLARKYHPDLNQDDKAAEAKFKDINEAYEVLKDDEKRKLYDQLGADWQHGQNFQRPPGFENFQFNFGNGGGGAGGFQSSDFSDFFSNLFGGGGRSGGFSGGFGGDPFGGFSQRPRRGSDVESQLNLTLEEAAKGGSKTIMIQGGSSLEVKIPAGVKEGARIRLAGKGESGPAGAGDLYLRVKYLPHPNFTLDENNLVYDLQLAPWEAALGVKVRIPTLGGEVELNIPAGSSSGKKLRLRDKGLGSGADKGDQFIRINIRMPEELAPEEKALWEKLQEISTFKAR